MVLIKSNHIRVSKSITNAVKKIELNNPKKLLIEIEVENLEQLREALSTGVVDIIMLDNMSLKEIEHAVKITRGKVKLEVSGGINKENVLKIAKTGVDYISIGALTHSVKALDISLRIY
jgi:nicotinate-nucleotide pyrophosphorylase (carboxylating)